MRCWALPGCRSTPRRGSGRGVGVGVIVGVGVGVGLGVGVGVGVPPPPWRLNLNLHWRAGLEEAYCSIVTRGGASASNRKLYSVPQRMALAF